MSELKQIDFALARVHGYGDLVDEISRLSAELDKARQEIRVRDHAIGNVFGCMDFWQKDPQACAVDIDRQHKEFEEQVAKSWRNQRDEAVNVLERLGSMEAFEVSRAIDKNNPADIELLARIEYARAVVDAIKGDK